MMRKKWLLSLIFVCLLFFPSLVLAVDFDILSYKGDLNIQADNTAVFKETITYRFKDDYNGQLVGLGKAGKMPEGFDIDANPTIVVSKNGEIVRDVLSYTEDQGDGYQVKIYNPGKAGDLVRVTVTWKLSNLLFLYGDIAELNWQPLTDSSGNIKELEFKVSSEVSAEELYFHTGNLFNEVSLEKVNEYYRVKMKDLPKNHQIELHAYWSRTAFSQAPDQGLVDNRLPAFKQIEANLANDKAMSKALVIWVAPIIILLLLIVSAVLFIVFKKKIAPRQKIEKNHRLYEPPMDLAPLILAEVVYSTSLKEVSPTIKGFGKFTFEELIQATLLDLMDRGNLSIFSAQKKLILKIVHEKGLANFEKECLQMIFSTKTEIPISDMFSDYEISDSLYKGAKKSDETSIQRTGSRVKYAFESQLQKVQDGIRDKVRDLGLPNYYRPLSTSERRLATCMWFCSIIAGFMGFLFFIYSLMTHDYLSITLLVLGLVGGLMTGLFYFETRSPYRDGVLTDEGAEIYYLWTSFENMLRDIAHLDKAELDSIIIWNRLLVYATLFGYAKTINKVMKLNQIKLGNSDLNLYVASGWYHQLHLSTTQMSHYASVANTAQHYSVSSGGGAGGGFSGGGGGGSVGAF